MAENDTIPLPRRKRGALVHPAGGAAPPGGRERGSQRGKQPTGFPLWCPLPTFSHGKVGACPALGQNRKSG